MWLEVTVACPYCIPLEVSVKISIQLKLKKYMCATRKDKMDEAMEPKKGARLEKTA